MARRPEQLLGLQSSPRWAAQVRLDLHPAEVVHWDPNLLRERRVVVPVDLQALVVAPGTAERFVPLPFALSTPDGADPAPMPTPFAPGGPRAPGVHLHWAMPDALLRGSMEEVPEGSENRLGLPALPDRWAVLRLLAVEATGTVHVRGWVLEADTARAVPLEDWPAGAGAVPQAGKTLTPEGITGTAGGSLDWTAAADAVVDRMSFHDPLDDVDRAAPGGSFNGLASYVVAGWWSQPPLDPLDGVQTTSSVHSRLAELRWSLMTDAEGGDAGILVAHLDADRRASLGLPTARRYVSDLGGDELLAVRERVRAAAAPGATTGLAQAARVSISDAAFFDDVRAVVPVEPAWPRSTLLHGSVLGVPVDGRIAVDQLPAERGLAVALGAHNDDVAGALVAVELEGADPELRRGVERVLSAFTGQLLDRIGTPDGLVDVEEHEHGGGFASLPGGPAALERLRPAGEAPLPAGRHARAAAGAERVVFSPLTGSKLDLQEPGPATQRSTVVGWSDAEAGLGPEPPEVRMVPRPAPRLHAPLEPVVAVRGPKRSLRMHHDGDGSPDGLLRVRWAEQIGAGYEGTVDGGDFIPSLGSGAIPPEVLSLAREALTTDPYLTPWLAKAAAARSGADEAPIRHRLDAEAAIRHGAIGAYDGSAAALGAKEGISRHQALVVGDQLRRFSIADGVAPAHVAVTNWAQPWMPLWLEWEVDLAADDRVAGWRLGPIDLQPEEDPPPVARTVAGRSPLQTGVATAMSEGIRSWLAAEDAREEAGDEGEADADTERALDEIADAIERLDVVSASLDSLHDVLLGLPVGDYGVLSARAGDGTLAKPAPVADPQLLLTGALRLRRARLVDAFGRVLDLPVGDVRLPTRDEIPEPARALVLRPRLLRPSRWMFRLVDPADPGIASPEATIDQIDPASMVNPVAGFLLPDHIDEALEAFDADGHPLGQLGHEPFGGGVVWEIAPGRPGPADAGPLHDLAPAQHPLGHLAAAMVAVDAQVRDGRPATGEGDSALTAMLRAIDTTLWTVDTFAALGNAHVAGLVGRPVAVVRAILRLEIDDDLDELDLSDEARRAAREAAYAALADRAFPVRLGEITRSDDGVLGFFVDDDYRRFHVVDKVVRDAALDVGRMRGQLGPLGATPQIPPVRPIDHPYVVAEDELLVRPGQVVRLTLLMHPAARVHLTSGILPRKSLQLARDWVNGGLSRMAPSIRVGPVLIEPGDVRLPKISSLPVDQLWTRRVSPAAWRDDPIVAATQAALLPEAPSGIEEGYIRVAAEEEEP
jgi:hypothetical protein